MSCGKECENCGQVGGDGYAMSMTENIAGQPVVEAYNCCDNAEVPAANVADATNQVGGGVNPFNFIINPVTGARLSLFSSGGKALLKNMIRQYKAGGAHEGSTPGADAAGSDANKEALTKELESMKGENDTELDELVENALALIKEGITDESLEAARKVLEKSKKVGEQSEDKRNAQEKLEKLIETLKEDLAKSAQEADASGKAPAEAPAPEPAPAEPAPAAPAAPAPADAPADAAEMGGKEDITHEGGAPAEMTDAFGEDYFNTEADALRGSWD